MHRLKLQYVLLILTYDFEGKAKSLSKIFTWINTDCKIHRYYFNNNKIIETTLKKLKNIIRRIFDTTSYVYIFVVADKA